MIEMTRCETCKRTYEEDYQYCLHCGKELMTEGDFPTVRMDSNPSKPKTTHRSKDRPSNVINFDRSSNKGIVANELTIKTTKKSIKLNPPPGIIASDSNMRAYAKYLIDRYNKFKSADRNITEMRHGVIYTAIKGEFKCNWDYVPITRFDDLVAYLQRRIDDTILGKNQKKQGKGRYETYSEWLNTR